MIFEKLFLLIIQLFIFYIPILNIIYFYYEVTFLIKQQAQTNLNPVVVDFLYTNKFSIKMYFRLKITLDHTNFLI